MHTDYIFSADVIAEQTKQYIRHNNLPMDLDNRWASRQWLLETYVQDVIEKHTQTDLRAEVGDENTIRKTVSDRVFELLKGNLDGYKEDQITFDNITPLVHAIFKGNWGIDVHVVQQLPNLDMWYISNVEFVEKDPNEQVTKEGVLMAIHKDYMRFLVMEDTPEAWADWDEKWEYLTGMAGGTEPENITLIMPDEKTPISDRAYSEQFMHDVLPMDTLDIKITTKKKWENRHRARIGLGMVEEIIQVAPHIKAYDWHKPFNDED